MRYKVLFHLIMGAVLAGSLAGCNSTSNTRIEIADTYNNGVVKEEKYYSRDNVLYADIKYFRTGDTMEVAKYKYRQLTSDKLLTRYHENGKVMSKVTHRSREFIDTTWYPNHQSIMSTVYTTEKYKVDTIFFYDGKGVISQMQLIKGKCPDTLCCCDGIHLDFDSGKLYSRCEMKDMNTDGLHEFFYPSGRLREQVYFRNCEYDSLDKAWFENGKLQREGIYRNDKRNGKWKFWTASGGWDEIYYIDGIATGACVGYEPDTSYSTWQRGQYKDGKRSGRWYQFDKDSILASEFDCINDEFTGEYIGYHKNGRIRLRGKEIKDQLEGLVSRYNDKGELTETDIYVKGKKVKSTKVSQ